MSALTCTPNASSSACINSSFSNTAFSSDLDEADRHMEQGMPSTPKPTQAAPLTAGAIVLPATPIKAIRWHGDGRYHAEAGMFDTVFSAGRHYDAPCAPFWVGSERRTDAAGRRWETQNIYFVTDSFGNLVEVTQ